jgi:DNA polymerase epsilon subunit 1
LHMMVVSLARKVFLQLLAQFKKFNSTIVFANFSKIIICTPNDTLQGAKDYVDRVVNAIQQRDLFAWIEIKPVQFWNKLLFVDNANYAGLATSGEGELNIDHHWNFVEHLPPHGEQSFFFITGLLLSELNKLRGETLKDGDDRIGELASLLSQHMFSLVGSARMNQNAEEHVPLELIKCCCYVLRLESHLEPFIETLQKSLLRMINVPEFAPQAQIKSTGETYVLAQVVCSFCNSCHDLDLLRDRTLADGQWFAFRVSVFALIVKKELHRLRSCLRQAQARAVVGEYRAQPRTGVSTARSAMHQVSFGESREHGDDLCELRRFV